MSVDTILTDPDAIELDRFVSSKDSIMAVVRSKRPSAACPMCSMPARRIHSRYCRTVADLPWQGVAVRLDLHVRKFFCDGADCRQRIFTERLPSVVAPYARRTIRLHDLVTLLGFSLGGEAGARVTAELRAATSPDTLLRSIRRAARSTDAAPEVVGVDDFAFRKGSRYGSMVVDLERRRVLDLLPDRHADTVAKWLEQHPGVKVLSRDRGGSYAEAARVGAPQAVQVADRWHLLKNLGDALERFLSRHVMVLRDATAAAIAALNAAPDESELRVPNEVGALAAPRLPPSQQRASQEKRARRLASYTTIHELAGHGLSAREISRRLKLARNTVRRYLRADTFPEKARPESRRSCVLPWTQYIVERWKEGPISAPALHRELKQQGFRGSEATLKRFLRQLRESGLEPSVTKVEVIKVPSPRRARWLLVRGDEDLDAKEQVLARELVRLCPEAATASQLAKEFQDMVRGRQRTALDGWLSKVAENGPAELRGFADGLRQDRAAVEEALSSPWSNGQLEGQINRLKAIKRSMYGRGKLDLLRARVLGPT